MSYIITIAIIIAVLIVLVFVGKLFVIAVAKKLAVILTKKAIKNVTQYAKNHIQTVTETKEEESKHVP